MKSSPAFGASSGASREDASEAIFCIIDVPIVQPTVTTAATIYPFQSRLNPSTNDVLQISSADLATSAPDADPSPGVLQVFSITASASTSGTFSVVQTLIHDCIEFDDSQGKEFALPDAPIPRFDGSVPYQYSGQGTYPPFATLEPTIAPSPGKMGTTHIAMNDLPQSDLDAFYRGFKDPNAGATLAVVERTFEAQEYLMFRSSIPEPVTSFDPRPVPTNAWVPLVTDLYSISGSSYVESPPTQTIHGTWATVGAMGVLSAAPSSVTSYLGWPSGMVASVASSIPVYPSPFPTGVSAECP